MNKRCGCGLKCAREDIAKTGRVELHTLDKAGLQHTRSSPMGPPTREPHDIILPVCSKEHIRISLQIDVEQKRGTYHMKSRETCFQLASCSRLAKLQLISSGQQSDMRCLRTCLKRNCMGLPCPMLISRRVAS